MAGTLVKCRFKAAWQTYRVGDVITPNGTLRDFLVGRGFCEIIDTGTVKAPLTRAVAKVRETVKRMGR